MALDEKDIAKLATEAKAAHDEIRALINRRIAEGNERREFGAAAAGVYAALRMASGQVLATLRAAGVSEQQLIEWARMVDTEVRRPGEER